jgi:hypothetical protein
MSADQMAQTTDDVRQAIDGHQFSTEAGDFVLRVADAQPTPRGQIAVRFHITAALFGDLLLTADRWTVSEVTHMAENTAKDILSGRLPPGAREPI